MKPLFILPCALFLTSFYNLNRHSFSGVFPGETTDTVIIDHRLDGSVSEWPADRFVTDKETGIAYAMDNDAQNLYIVMSIGHPGEQMKVMRMGMNLYIDMKGKKKENRGVEFPIKKEISNENGSFQRPTGESQEGQKGSFDTKRMRMMMAINLIHLKQFGFTEGEPIEEDLQVKGSPNIAFNWDSTEVMHIEYLIPLKLLSEDISSLEQKNISIGWKINGADMTSSNRTVGIGGPTGSGIGGNLRPGGRFSGGRTNNSGSSEDREKMMKEQSLWTKYTFTIPTSK